MEKIIKKFTEWFSKKETLHNLSHKVPLVTVGDIWWIAMGENIGSEINGKSEKFSRPAIIYKKLSHSFYLVIPTTSGTKVGSWYCNFNFKGKDMSACLHQIRVVDYRRVYDNLGQLSSDEFKLVKDKFLELYK